MIPGSDSGWLEKICVDAAREVSEKPIEKPRPFDSGRVMPENEALTRNLKRMAQMEGGIK